MTEKENQQFLFTLTDHINKNRKEQSQLLQQFRYKFAPQSQLSQSHHKESFIHHPMRSQTITSKPEHSELTCTQITIDNQASLVNGMLVMFQEEKKQIGKDRKELMRLLRENNITYKEYILGNKSKFLRQIQQNQKKKQEEIMKDYLRKHVNRQKAAKVEVAADFQQNKANLFSNK